MARRRRTYLYQGRVREFGLKHLRSANHSPSGFLEAKERTVRMKSLKDKEKRCGIIAGKAGFGDEKNLDGKCRINVHGRNPNTMIHEFGHMHQLMNKQPAFHPGVDSWMKQKGIW